MKRALIFLLFAASLLTGCDNSRIYEMYQRIEGSSWTYKDIKTFSVPISDTSDIYNIYVNIRSLEDYQYNNLWVKIGIQAPDGQKSNQRVEIILANTAGKWFGDALGDIHDRRYLIAKDARFPKKGNYIFTIQQDMRIDPVPGVMDAGIRVEKEK